MGNNICQCKIIYQNFKEADLSSNKSSKKISLIEEKEIQMNKKNDINNNNKFDLSLIKQKSLKMSSEKLEKIYMNNYVNKIIKSYLNYKRKKIKKKEDLNNGISRNIKENNDNNNQNVNNNNSFNNKDNGENGNYVDMNHPFFIDKVHHSKTNYEKIDIPKINNGMSLEILINKNAKDFNKNNIQNKKKINKNYNNFKY